MHRVQNIYLWMEPFRTAAQQDDADFDSYWEDQSRNRNRNRIRVGRQYQAIVPPLLKPGEADGRCLEDLETLKWKPNNELSEQQIDQYVSMARAVSLFAKAIDTCQNTGNGPDRTLQTALRGLSDFVASHHPCHHDAGCQVPSPSCCGDHNCKHTVANGWTPAEAHLFAQALEVCGKNFGAIKKDYLPWKPVRSIIEFYYQGKNEKFQDLSEQQLEEINSTEETMVQKESTSQTTELKQEERETDCESVGKQEELDTKVEKIELKSEANASSTDASSEEPITEKLCQPKDETSSNLGSLSFFLGGQLVLKLNAQQDNGPENQNCQWVLSQDTPKIPPARKSRKSKKSCKHGSISSVSRDDSQKDVKPDVSSDTTEEGSGVKKAKLKSDCALSSSSVEDVSDYCSIPWLPPTEPKKEQCDDSVFRTENWCQSFSSLHLSQCKNENCNHQNKVCAKSISISDCKEGAGIKTEPSLSPSYINNSTISPNEEDTNEQGNILLKSSVKSGRNIDVKHKNRMPSALCSNQMFPSSSSCETSSSAAASAFSGPQTTLSPHGWPDKQSNWKNSPKLAEVIPPTKKEPWAGSLSLQDMLDGAPLDLSKKPPSCIFPKTSGVCETSSEMLMISQSSCSTSVTKPKASHLTKSSTCQPPTGTKSAVLGAKSSPPLNELSHTSLPLHGWNLHVSHAFPHDKNDSLRKDYHDSHLMNKTYQLGCGYSQYGMTVAYAPTVFPPMYSCKKECSNKDKPVNLSKKSDDAECDKLAVSRESETEERCAESSIDLVPWMVVPHVPYSQLHSPYCPCCISYTDTSTGGRVLDPSQFENDTPLDLTAAAVKTNISNTGDSENTVE